MSELRSRWVGVQIVRWGFGLGLAVLWLQAAAVSAAPVVGIDGNVTIVHADTGTWGAPPQYLRSNTGSADPTWYSGWVEHPTSLTGSPVVGAVASATFYDPFDPMQDLPIPMTADAAGSATYNASHGQLRARVDASANVYPSSYFAVDPKGQLPPVAIDNPYFPGAFARIGLYYFDEITFASGSLAAGIPISIQLTMRHDTSVLSSAGVGGGPPYPNHAYSQSTLDVWTYDQNWNSLGQSGRLASLTDENVLGVMTRDDVDVLVFTFNLVVGGHLDLRQTLETHARATSYFTAAQTLSYADSSNTAGVTLRSLTPDVTIVAGSGASYAAVVPEPAAGLLLAVGGLVATRRCRRKPAAR